MIREYKSGICVEKLEYVIKLGNIFTFTFGYYKNQDLFELLVKNDKFDENKTKFAASCIL